LRIALHLVEVFLGVLLVVEQISVQPCGCAY
jgi:hypothetical protein